MTNRLTKLARTTYIPAVQGTPGSPARCYTTSYVTNVYQNGSKGPSLSGSSGASVSTSGGGSNGSQPTANYVDPFDVLTGGAGTGWVTTPAGMTSGSPYYATQKVMYQTVCVPAVPATPAKPAQTLVSTQPGWNAGARSRATIAGDFHMQFNTAPAPVGVLCGAANSGLNDSPTFSQVEHGFLVTAVQIAVVESGSIVATSPVDPAATPILSILRVGSKVTYTVDSWSYTSTKGSFGSKRMQAVLYAASDFVDNPQIVSADGMAGSTLFGWDASTDAGAPMRGSTLFGWDTAQAATGSMAVTLPPIHLRMSDRPYSDALMVLPAPAVSMYGGLPVISAGGMDVVVPLTSVMYGSTGEVGGMDTSLAPIVLRMSDYPYADMQVRMGPLFTSMMQATEAPGEWTTATALGLRASYLYDPTIFALITEGLQLSSTLDLLFIFTADLFEFLAIGDDMSVAMVLEAFINNGLRVTDNITQARKDLLQYATNIVTGGVTRYEGFGFSSFATVGQRSFGVRPDGVYELVGAYDDGELRRAAVDFAMDDFGTAQRKRVTNVYLGMNTDGQVFLCLVGDDGKPSTYRVTNHGDTSKVCVSQRPSARYWQARLEIAAASEAEVVNVEWYVGATGRRIGR